MKRNKIQCHHPFQRVDVFIGIYTDSFLNISVKTYSSNPFFSFPSYCIVINPHSLLNHTKHLSLSLSVFSAFSTSSFHSCYCSLKLHASPPHSPLHCLWAHQIGFQSEKHLSFLNRWLNWIDGNRMVSYKNRKALQINIGTTQLHLFRIASCKLEY